MTQSLNIYLFAASIICSHYAFNMEENTEKKVIIESQEIENSVKPYKYVDLNSKGLRYVDEKNKIIEISSQKPFGITTYDLDGNIIKTYENEGYIRLYGPNKKVEPITFLFKGTFKKQDKKLYEKIKRDVLSHDIYNLDVDDLEFEYITDESKPFFIYKKDTNEITQLDYSRKDGDTFGFLTIGATNLKDGDWKCISLYNSKTKTTNFLLFNKENKHISTITQEDNSYNLDISPSGNFLLFSVVNHVIKFNLYDIRDKEKPQKTHIIQSNLCWWDREEDVFCDCRNIRDQQGNILQTLTEEREKFALQFSKKYYILRDIDTKTTILHRIDRSEKPLQLYHDWNVDRTDCSSIINEKEEAILWTPRGFPFQKIAFYKTLKNQESNKNEKSGYFSNCVIN